jgi:hypothetical protein
MMLSLSKEIKADEDTHLMQIPYFKIGYSNHMNILICFTIVTILLYIYVKYQNLMLHTLNMYNIFLNIQFKARGKNEHKGKESSTLLTSL